MSLYKCTKRIQRVALNQELAVIHAEAINMSFKTLGHDFHDSQACDFCQENGITFRALVRENLNSEVTYHVS